jgi:triphosphatase
MATGHTPSGNSKPASLHRVPVARPPLVPAVRPEIIREPTNASQVKLSNKQSIEQAFQEIIVNCMAQISANEAGLIAGVAHNYSAEYLHQMRVGLRRLQCALKVFKDVIRLPADLRRELKWIKTTLSTARDWDVLSGKTLVLFSESLSKSVNTSANASIHKSTKDTLPPATLSTLSDVILAATAQAHENRKSAAIALTSQRYTALMLYLSFWVHAYAWRETSSARTKRRLQITLKKNSLKKYSLTKIKTLRRCLSRQCRKICIGKPRTLHKLRIAAKNARYTTEFFHSFCQKGKYLKRLASFQEMLGNNNDLIVARRLLKQLAQARPELRAAIKLTRAQLANLNHPKQKHIHQLCAKLN